MAAYTLDKADRKILAELDADSRQGFSSMAKKTRIPLHVVAYRIKRMADEGLIKKFTTLVALGKLGFFVYKIYFQLTGMPAEKEKLMTNYLLENKKVSWVAKSEGQWDLMIAVYARDIVEFGKIKDEIFFRYGRYVSDYAITMVKETYVLRRSYFLEEERHSAQEELYVGGNVKCELKDGDKKLLRLLVENSRLSAMELAEKTRLNIKTVLARLKELKRLGVIQGYGIELDLRKIDYKYYKLCIYLSKTDENGYKRLVDYFRGNPNVKHLIEAIGPWELELEVEVKKDEDFYNLNRNIRNVFTDNVKRIESVVISDEMKLDFLPYEF
ncbi:HTH-type transcriptional regulator Ptr2 [Candidatus Burarchaeum australiense]|nr:HTH-type transcriptional regulator Ptr2 [Candidatus Burarchaeum australiense]